MLVIVMAVAVAVVPAAAQESLRDVVLQQIPGGYDLVESGPNNDVRMIDEWDSLPWRTAFEGGTSIVEISAFDYRDLPRALAGHATMADRMEETMRNADTEFATDEVVIREQHPDEPGVTWIRWVLDGVDFAHLGFYIEGDIGYLISVVDADSPTFEAILFAQLDHSPGERVTTPLSEARALYDELTEGEVGEGGDAGSVFAALVVVGGLVGLIVWGVRTMRSHGGGRERPRHGTGLG